MVSNIFGTFNRAIRSMQSAQYGMGVHSSNIAHANDPNYTRRELVPDSIKSLGGPGIARLRDAFIDDQYRQVSGRLGQAGAKQDLMSKVEDIFGDPVNGGLRPAIDQFFDAWKGLAENPTDGVARLTVLSAGRTFSERIVTTHAQLVSLEQAANGELQSRVDEVNTQLQRVYDLNLHISELNRNRMPDADLRDQRDEALDALAKLVGATTSEQPDGTVRVFVGPTNVIDGPTVVRLKLVGSPPANPDATWDAYSTPTYLGTGTIKGLLDVRDGEIRQLKEEILSLGKTVATKVNDLHATGKGLTGQTGLTFFDMGVGPTAGLIKVNAQLKPEEIAASGGSGEVSDGQLARQIANLADSPITPSAIMQGQMQAPRVFYRNLVGWIGNRANDAVQQGALAGVQQRTMEEHRQSEWGVSLDEEMANLTIQQKSFGAAARVITVMDEMLDHLINRMGR